MTSKNPIVQNALARNAFGFIDDDDRLMFARARAEYPEEYIKIGGSIADEITWYLQKKLPFKQSDIQSLEKEIRSFEKEAVEHAAQARKDPGNKALFLKAAKVCKRIAEADKKLLPLAKKYLAELSVSRNAISDYFTNALSHNAKFKVGDKVRVAGIGSAVIKTVDEIKSVVGPRVKYGIDIGGGRIMNVPEKDVVKNAVTNDWKSYETAADIIKHATQAAQELEAMVKKATPWRAEMARMRQRADKLNDAYYGISSVDKGDPLYGKAVDAVKRWEKARAAAGDLWFSI